MPPFKGTTGMASKESNSREEKDLKNALKIAVLSSALTLAGVVATNVTSWISSAQTTRSSERLSCISRLDKREEYARAKSDAFISSLAALASGSASPDFQEKKPAYVETFSKAGYSLMLLDDTELGKKSGELADWMTVRVSDYKSFVKPVFVVEEYEKLVTDWKDAYYQHMADLDTQRKGC
ncbi:hypothetical protein [Pseudomonas sp. E102]|jgi:hypothetical protein|uniref:hypothetical protein n=1 Tax=Pseudomonas sp. E102 TaxID=181579 RepID=UPI004045551E